MSDLVDGMCPFCGAEVIPSQEADEDGPQRLVCCRLLPLCGAVFTLNGWLVHE